MSKAQEVLCEFCIKIEDDIFWLFAVMGYEIEYCWQYIRCLNLPVHLGGCPLIKQWCI